MKMDKELKEMLKEFMNKMYGTLAKSNKKMLDEAINEPCKIHLDKESNGKAQLEVGGSRLAILIGLSALEKEVLEQLHCTQDEFDILKKMVGTREANDNE